MTRRSLIARYAAFALVATVANLGVQRAVLGVGDGAVVLAAAIAAGTLVGLALKFWLDRRWIFGHHDEYKYRSDQQFALYAATGIVTTAIFWGLEVSFWAIWRTDVMRELGAVIGLGIGYVVKYRLDRRFVFVNRPLAPSS